MSDVNELYFQTYGNTINAGVYILLYVDSSSLVFLQHILKIICKNSIEG